MKGLEGSRLGRYELRFRVAQGGMSEVYLGYDRRVKRYVAVKVLYGSDEPFVHRFEREALSIGTLSHDHILPLYDFGEQRPWYYLVMPFVEGGTLRDYLAKRERLTLEEAGSFLEQIASALQYAHDHGVIHRDVKPSNILLRPDGHAYLADFGLAKAKISSEFLNHSGAMVGTPEYMAPEQSNGQNDNRSDIYSLGIILYQMLTGCVPFTADTPVGVTLKHLQTSPTPPGQLNNMVPEAIEEIMLKALEKAPEDRFQEARSFANAYKKALIHERTRDLGEEAVALVTTLETETISHAQPTDKTRAFLAQITTQLHLPSTKPQLYPLEGGVPSFIPYATKQYHQKQRRKPLYIVLISLILAICSLLTLVLMQQHSPGQHIPDPARPISRQSQHATATELAHARIQATLAAQARVQATAGITSSINAGHILYYNDLTLKSPGWLDDGNQCYFSLQGYHVHTYFARTVAWCYSNQQSFTNMVITVQAHLIYGGFCGVVFRLKPYSKAFYVLELNSLGEYRFQRALGNDPDHWLTLIDWTTTSAIARGYNTVNTILITATGSHFQFYINHQLTASTFADTTYQSGLIGLLVGGDTSDGTEAIFKNLVIFQK